LKAEQHLNSLQTFLQLAAVYTLAPMHARAFQSKFKYTFI